MNQELTGKFIAQLRKEKNLTQKELADKLGISDKTVSKW
jgi:transcriptional regulator with XRE-family HTH domain